MLINWLCRLDGFVSIERAFTRDELHSFAVSAGVPERNIAIQWVWPFRWLVVLSKDAPPATSAAAAAVESKKNV